MVTKQEWRWLLVFCAVIVILTTLPYVLAYARQGNEWAFTGFIIGVEDGNSYIAKMLTGANGAWLFRSPYSAFPQKGFLAFFPYIILGKLSSPPGQHEQLVSIFHIYRSLASVLLIIATYKFASIFIDRIAARRLCVVVITLGSGSGWLAIFGFSGLWQGRLPLEFYSPESFGFLEFFGLPHLAMGRALMLVVLQRYSLLTFRQSSIWYSVVTGLLLLIAGLFQPLDIVIIWMILTGHTALTLIAKYFANHTKMLLGISSDYVLRVAIIIIISAPLVIYNIASFQYNFYLHEWQKQNVILSPPVTDYLLAYFPAIVFAVVGGIILFVKKINNQSKKDCTVLLMWVILLPLLIYFPVNFQRRMSEGVWVAIILLVFMTVELFSRKLRRVLQIGLLITPLTTVIVYAGTLQSIWTPREPLYRPAGEVEVFKYLGEETLPGSTVLANYHISNALPAWTPNKVITGLGPESIFLPEMIKLSNGFYENSLNDIERENFLDEFAINYVIWGPEESKMTEWSPQITPGFSIIYSSENYILLNRDEK